MLIRATPAGQGGGEEDADCRIFLNGPLAGKEADAQGHDHGRHQGADKEVAFEQISNRYSRQDGMGHGVTQKGHRSQHHVASDNGTEHAHHERRRQTSLHESIRQRRKQPVDHLLIPLSNRLWWIALSTTTAPFNSSTCPPKACSRCSEVSTCSDGP